MAEVLRANIDWKSPFLKGMVTLAGCPLVLESGGIWRIVFQAGKLMKNSKGHVKSWKMMIMSWNLYCTEKFCSRTANEVVLDRLL